MISLAVFAALTTVLYVLLIATSYVIVRGKVSKLTITALLLSATSAILVWIKVVTYLS